MGCTGCDYTSNCSSYIKASYIPTISHDTRGLGASYSHSAVNDPAEYQPAGAQYQSAAITNSNGYLPIELDYRISKALKDIEDKMPEPQDNLPAVVEASRNEPSITVLPRNIEVMPPKPLDHIMQMQQGYVPQMAQFITEIEEVTLRIRKVRQTVVRPTGKSNDDKVIDI